MTIKYRKLEYDKPIYSNAKNQFYRVLSSLNSKDITIAFENTGYIRKTTIARMCDGQIKDFYEPSVQGVGYLGDGLHNPATHRTAYVKWRDMLTRCYNETYHKRQPTYADCCVCEEWHNFQNFAEWFYSQPNHQEDVQLDKDIKVGYGNKVYSKETCSLISRLENNNPVYKNHKEGCVSNQCSYIFVNKEGDEFSTRNINQFALTHGLNPSHMYSIVKGDRKTHKGWRFEFTDTV